MVSGLNGPSMVPVQPSVVQASKLGPDIAKDPFMGAKTVRRKGQKT